MIRILEGDCRQGMAGLAAASVHLVITSPPYWALRDYGLEPVVWGGDDGCAHVWGEEKSRHSTGGIRSTSIGGGQGQRTSQGSFFTASTGTFCQHCPAWRGSLGLEPTPDCAGWATGAPCGQCYVCHMLEVFAGVWRVLRPEGVCWVNLGDSYNNAGSSRNGTGLDGKQRGGATGADGTLGYKKRDLRHALQSQGIKHKDLCGLPWRVAFALQARGWYLRSAPPWIKANPMPENATDRPGTGHEMWFMLTKRAKYFWDQEAVRRPNNPRSGVLIENINTMKDRPGNGVWPSGTGGRMGSVHTGRNLRTTDFFHQGLTDHIAATTAHLAHLEAIQANGGLLLAEDGTPAALVYNTQAYKDAHFATFSAAMIRPLIQGGTSERGCCPGCGAPWVRDIAVSYGKSPKHGDPATSRSVVGRHAPTGQNNYDGAEMPRMAKQVRTTGWSPSCPCPSADPIPCTVFDPFAGACTTLLVADQLGRHAVGCEAQADYVAMAHARLTAATPLFTAVETVPVVDPQQTLWE